MGTRAWIVFLIIATIAVRDLGTTGAILWLMAIGIMCLADKCDQSETEEEDGEASEV